MLQAFWTILRRSDIQLWTFAYIRLLNKPYENEVILREQNPPLKCNWPLEISTSFEMGLDLLLLITEKIKSLAQYGLQSC